ncbi:hypothetical protein D3C83_89210 [compost metagenome]
MTYADAEIGYRPTNNGDFFNGGGGDGEIDPERMKKILKERLNIDWDSLNEQERQQRGERFRRRQQGGEAPKPDASTVGR